MASGYNFLGVHLSSEESLKDTLVSEGWPNF